MCSTALMCVGGGGKGQQMKCDILSESNTAEEERKETEITLFLSHFFSCFFAMETKVAAAAAC